MKKLKLKTVFPLLFLLLFVLSDSLAQELTTITGTNLSIQLAEGWKADEGSSTIMNDKYNITFIEMVGADFNVEVKDFDQIESTYAEKGITVEKKHRWQIATYDALFLHLASEPPVLQIFFGDESFCAIANVFPVDTSVTIEEKEIESVLAPLNFEDKSATALTEHANFILHDDSNHWVFQHYAFSTFMFEHQKTKDGLMLVQLPVASLASASKKELAEEFIGKFKNKIPELKLVEQGHWKINTLDGYRVIFSCEEKGLKLLYFFIFASERSVFVFQGMGKKNDLATRARYETLLKDLALKK